MHIEAYWEDIKQLLMPVIEIAYNEVTIEGIKQRLMSGNELALVALYGECVICICVLGTQQFETGKRVLEMPYIGGNNIDMWLDEGWKYILNIAKDLGCSHIRGNGRAGWERKVPELKKIRTVYEYAL